MFFQYRLIFLLLLSIGVFFFRGNAQDSGSKKYKSYYINKALVIDGIPDEPQWQTAAWSDAFVDIEGAKRAAPPLHTRMKMLWNKHYLYIAAKLEEPHLWATLTNRDAIIYHDNDFEVFIDPDGDGLNYYELEINAFGTEFDLFLPKPYAQKGKPDLVWNFEGLKSAVHQYGTINKPEDTDTAWTVEMAIPWTAFSAENGQMPENGDSWRINFSRVQWDLEITDGQYTKKKNPENGENLPEHNWVWSPQGEVNMHIPEKWGFVEFEGKPDDSGSQYPTFWIWMGADKHKTDSDWDSTFRELKETGITGILMSADSAVLTRIIPIADKLEMEVHAWFWTMNRSDAEPEWMSVNQLGQSLAEQKAYVDYYKFMCPALPETKTFIKSKMEPLTSIKGLKGIHMDYIRYVDVILPVGLWDKYDLVQDHIMPEYDYGYHPYMRKLFREKYGMDPFELENVESDSVWLKFRMDELNKTVIELRDFVNSRGMDITAAVFPTPEMSREMVRQDWDQWGLDCYFPMVYHNFYNEDIDWIRKVVSQNKAELKHNEKVFCGLYLPALQKEDDLTKAMQAAFDGGANGIAFFDLHALTESQKIQIRKLNLREKD